MELQEMKEQLLKLTARFFKDETMRKSIESLIKAAKKVENNGLSVVTQNYEISVRYGYSDERGAEKKGKYLFVVANQYSGDIHNVENFRKIYQLKANADGVNAKIQSFGLGFNIVYNTEYEKDYFITGNMPHYQNKQFTDEQIVQKCGMAIDEAADQLKFTTERTK